MLGVVRARWFLLLLLLGSVALSGQWPGSDLPAEAEAPTPEAANPPLASEHALRCEAALRARPAGSAVRRPRIGTWNVRWFPRGSAKGKNKDARTDVRWLACEIATLDLDVLALQELLDTPDARNAQADLVTQLDVLTGGAWRVELDPCPSGNQHVAFLWDTRRVELSEPDALAALNPHGKACASGLRPGLRASARFKGGERLDLITLHLDSGEKLRDFTHRSASIEALTGLLASNASAIVLGDYNSMGCTECLPTVSAQQELAALDERLASRGLARVAKREGSTCSYYYKQRPTLLDHVVVTRALASRARLETAGACARLGCERPPRKARIPEWRTLSDHCPLVLELAPLKPKPKPKR
jgi:endonuclease/exonuclease/phosphatase family metal-dependent hydrolase